MVADYSGFSSTETIITRIDPIDVLSIVRRLQSVRNGGEREDLFSHDSLSWPAASHLRVRYLRLAVR